MTARFCSMFVRAFATIACGALLVAAMPASGERAPPVILLVGDSVSAGYGLPTGAGWATLLQQRLDARHLSYRVVNASISGDTTAGGRARLGALLAQYRPAITIIELGGNDGLRGGSLDAMRANLEAMTAAAQSAGSRVVLVGIRVPPNYGAAYGERFAAIYAEVARARKAALVPFLFEGFAEDDAMFQPDRIHPLASAQAKMLDNVWPSLAPLLGASAKAA
ncbi:MAG TPA: arylesterase [Casimicrobiaceae bacterium]|nr:arylesterase [Casimicrobiaceae bacterium]